MRYNSSLNDACLSCIDRCRNSVTKYMKSHATLSALFANYHRDLKRFVAKKFGSDEAEDIVQDAFHNILRSGTHETLENPKAYLFQTAHNLALNRLRKQGRHDDYLATQDMTEATTAPLEVSTSAMRDLELVEKTIAQLPCKCRRAFILSRLQGKNYAEIAETLGVSVSTVEKYIAKSLLFLREHLD